MTLSAESARRQVNVDAELLRHGPKSISQPTQPKIVIPSSNNDTYAMLIYWLCNLCLWSRSLLMKSVAKVSCRISRGRQSS